MTSREALALSSRSRRPCSRSCSSRSRPGAGVVAVAVAAAIPAAALALALAAVALVERGRSDGRQVGRARRGGRAARSPSSALVGLASVLASPAYLGTAAGRPVRDVLRAALRLLGAAARGAARREPRRRVAARRGDDRAVGAARRLQRQGARARGRLEVPDPHLARARRRAARDRRAWPPGSPAGSARSRGPSSARYASGSETALVAYLLLLAGLAAKIGWAPVHNWLPDAHSEAPAPVSALLSAALLPSVLLVAWRSEQALAPVIGVRTRAGAC